MNKRKGAIRSLQRLSPRHVIARLLLLTRTSPRARNSKQKVTVIPAIFTTVDGCERVVRNGDGADGCAIDLATIIRGVTNDLLGFVIRSHCWPFNVPVFFISPNSHSLFSPLPLHSLHHFPTYYCFRLPYPPLLSSLSFPTSSTSSPLSSFSF